MVKPGGGYPPGGFRADDADSSESFVQDVARIRLQAVEPDDHDRDDPKGGRDELPGVRPEDRCHDDGADDRDHRPDEDHVVGLARWVLVLAMVTGRMGEDQDDEPREHHGGRGVHQVVEVQAGLAGRRVEVTDDGQLDSADKGQPRLVTEHHREGRQRGPDQNDDREHQIGAGDDRKSAGQQQCDVRRQPVVVKPCKCKAHCELLGSGFGRGMRPFREI